MIADFVTCVICHLPVFCTCDPDVSQGNDFWVLCIAVIQGKHQWSDMSEVFSLTMITVPNGQEDKREAEVDSTKTFHTWGMSNSSITKFCLNEKYLHKDILNGLKWLSMQNH